MDFFFFKKKSIKSMFALYIGWLHNSKMEFKISLTSHNPKVPIFILIIYIFFYKIQCHQHGSKKISFLVANSFPCNKKCNFFTFPNTGFSREPSYKPKCPQIKKFKFCILNLLNPAVHK